METTQMTLQINADEKTTQPQHRVLAMLAKVMEKEQDESKLIVNGLVQPEWEQLTLC